MMLEVTVAYIVFLWASWLGIEETPCPGILIML